MDFVLCRPGLSVCCKVAIVFPIGTPGTYTEIHTPSSPVDRDRRLERLNSEIPARVAGMHVIN